MNALLILLLLVAGMGVGLALMLVQSLRGTQALPDSDILSDEISRLEERYDIIGRMASETGAQRRRLMRRQLGALRSDFWRFWNLCRLLAPYQEDPEFATILCTQLVTFHCLWIAIWMGTYGWDFENARCNFIRVVDTVKLLRESAQAGVEGVERVAFETTAL